MDTEQVMAKSNYVAFWWFFVPVLSGCVVLLQGKVFVSLCIFLAVGALFGYIKLAIAHDIPDGISYLVIMIGFPVAAILLAYLYRLLSS